MQNPNQENPFFKVAPNKKFQALIPLLLQDYCINPISSELRVCYDAPTNQSSLTYTLTWDKNISEEYEFEKALLEEKLIQNYNNLARPKLNNLDAPKNEPKSPIQSLNYAVPTKNALEMNYPAKDEKITVKMVILTAAKDYGVFYDHCKVQSKFSKSIINPISKMLFNNGKDEADYLKTGELYYAELHPDFERKMYKIEKPEYKKLKLNNIPKIYNDIALVLDLGGYVKSGRTVYFE